MILTCPDSSDGRAADMLSVGRWLVQIPLRANVLKALVWRLHVRFPCSYVQNGLYPKTTIVGFGYT